MTRILALETSCDETAAAVVEDGRTILSSVVASQAAEHAGFGGVFPEVAARMHVEVISQVIERALAEAHLSLGQVDAIAATRGPGLPGSLVVGLNAAKGLSLARGLPLLGINHLEGHIYSLALTEEVPEYRFPLVVLIVSGGHTELLSMHGHGHYERLGGTLDDAAGEAFDKVARLLGLGYPGGPAIEHAARAGDPTRFAFSRAWLDGTWNFSFSGLKTAVLYAVRGQPYGKPLRGPETAPDSADVPDLAAGFQAAAIEVLAVKTARAAEQVRAKAILVAGGVSANAALRAELTRLAPCPVYTPPLALCTDNAAMIAAAAHPRYLAGQRDALDIDVMPNWKLAS
jgi:N6-L-threonylcarbamoyladenine synthase